MSLIIFALTIAWAKYELKDFFQYIAKSIREYSRK